MVAWGIRLLAGGLAAAVIAACAPQRADGPVASVDPTTTAAGPSAQPSLADAIRRWEDEAGDHFEQSARALERVSEAADSGDEAAVRSGCAILHDTNSIGLQGHLPTPDPELTEQLQRMIDDMNSATHACLRFALERDAADAANYQDYLSRAVAHLQQAKVILQADLGRR